MIINFDQIYEDLKSGVEGVAKQSLQDYLSEAKTAGQAALNNMKVNLLHWAQEAENGALTKEDLEFLLQEESAFEELAALKQAGITEIRIDEFKNAIINTILGTIASFIKI
ncbi:hypothetical protein DC498_11015 [Terrimonas sp.]|uniref:hypothetical protein n=1 Tax=Terrimonas sp. TaxID=1914338 RepID=UPI000D51AAD4|nr:hypothetical protein [Terrimonas sp.]PVD52246.1 hypothetical protein DC498_11015 [Terrimonas sp.]